MVDTVAGASDGVQGTRVSDAGEAISIRLYVFGAIALLGWAGLWLVSKIWGETLHPERMLVFAPPLTAIWHRQLNISIVPMLILGGACAFGLPKLADRLRFSQAVVSGAVATFGFSCVLVLNQGWEGFIAGVNDSTGYLFVIPRVHGVRRFLHDYVSQVLGHHMSTHAQGHPPGMVLVAWGLNQLGWRGPRLLAVFVVAGGALAVAGVIVTLRIVAGERLARAALPFVAVSPACVWIASSADAFFAAVAAWTLAAVAAAVVTSGRRSYVYATFAGVLYFVALMLSYGLAVFVVPIVALCIWRRRFVVLLIVGAVTIIAMLALRTTGFWWFDGLRATKRVYYETIALERPYRYFVIANIAILGIVIGPMGAVGLAWLRDRRAWLVVGSVAVAVAVADISGLSKAEVERIWLPFSLFLLGACAGLWRGRNSLRSAQWALAMQLGFAIWIQTSLTTLW